MRKYRKKPEFVEAVQWDGTEDHADNIADFIPAESDAMLTTHKASEFLDIKRASGDVAIRKGGWIILKGGDVFPVSQGMFEATYELAE